MWRHLPENLLAVLFLTVTVVTMYCRPVTVPVRLLLVPVGWVLAFCVWVGIIWVACKFHDIWADRK